MIGFINNMTATDTPRFPQTTEETIACAFVRALLDLAVAKGANRADLLNQSRIGAEQLNQADGRLPLVQWVSLMRAGKAATGDPALPLHFGEADIGEISVLGLMGHSVETVAEGLEMLNRFCKLVADVGTEDGERFKLEVNKGETWLIDTRLNPNQSPEVSETGFAQLATMARRLVPDVQHFRAVHFTHPEPVDRSEHKRVFQAPVVFNSARNGLLLHERWEAQRTALQPRYGLDMLSDHAESLLARLDEHSSMRSRVEEQIRSVLDAGRPSAASVAAALKVSQQTLYRRLREEDVSFDLVLDQVRFKLAAHCLHERGLSMKDTAHRLGFSDATAFSRAFKRWSGVSPRNFTAHRGHNPAGN